MGQLKLSLHPLFLLFSFFLVYLGDVKLFAVYFVVLILHEMAHFIVAKILGYKLNKIIFMPYGAGISGDNNIFKPSNEILIALAGPLFNFVSAIIVVALWWIFPTSYGLTYMLVEVNLVIGIFNLLPIYPLDGGRVLVALLTQNKSKIFAYKIMKIIGLVFGVFFAILFFISVFYTLNITLFFISVFLIVSSFGGVTDAYYERSFVLATKKENINPIEVKTYIVNKNTSIYSLIKYIKGNYFVQFYLVDDFCNVVKILTEIDIKRMIIDKYK